MRIYIQVLALLCGTAFLLMASGLHGLLLPLRGGVEGFSVTSLGMLGTTWAGGFVAGCLFAPRLVRRVGMYAPSAASPHRLRSSRSFQASSWMQRSG